MQQYMRVIRNGEQVSVSEGTHSTVFYKCNCCGFVQEFNSKEEAFDQGWDIPPYFTGYITCNFCPAAYVVLGQTWKHKEIHEKWAKEGRPNAKFN